MPEVNPVQQKVIADLKSKANKLQAAIKTSQTIDEALSKKELPLQKQA